MQVIFLTLQVDDRDTEAGKNLGYKDIVRENPVFETFYQAQAICPEDQWDDFMAVLKTDLPAAFRITGTRYVLLPLPLMLHKSQSCFADQILLQNTINVLL